MIRSTSLFAAASLAASLAGCATPPPEPPSPPISFVILDADGDGRVTRDAWDTYSRAIHARLDSVGNGDGGLDSGEMDRAFDSFDLDGSGTLTIDEIDISLLDTNSDGIVTQAEWEGGIVREGLDMDRNGRVSVEEMIVRRHMMFTELDRNATGVISQNEIDDRPPYTLFRL